MMFQIRFDILLPVAVHYVREGWCDAVPMMIDPRGCIIVACRGNGSDSEKKHSCEDKCRRLASFFVSEKRNESELGADANAVCDLSLKDGVNDLVDGPERHQMT